MAQTDIDVSALIGQISKEVEAEWPSERLIKPTDTIKVEMTYTDALNAISALQVLAAIRSVVNR